MVPARFGTIDDYLPKARTLIANEAEAVIASDKAANQTRSAMQSGQTAVANVLEAARMKQQNEEEFLSAVLGYNEPSRTMYFRFAKTFTNRSVWQRS